jgi:hypothetical protein
MGIVPIPWGSINKRLDYGVFRFTLSREEHVIAFFPKDDLDYQEWKNALTSVSIQSDIWSQYNFKEMLGQGSYGKVFLANKS